MLSVELLQILTCPECGGPVVGEEEHVYCADEHCRKGERKRAQNLRHSSYEKAGEVFLR